MKQSQYILPDSLASNLLQSLYVTISVMLQEPCRDIQ